MTLRFLPPDVDRAALLPPLKRVFARGKLAAAEIESERRAGPPNKAAAAAAAATAGAGPDGRGGGYGAVETKRAQFSAISRELNQIFFEFPFTVPRGDVYICAHDPYGTKGPVPLSIRASLRTETMVLHSYTPNPKPASVLTRRARNMVIAAAAARTRALTSTVTLPRCPSTLP